MFDLRRLSIFVTVAERGSITAASQRLFMTQSAVSQQISILEREVGVPLLRRRPRGVEVTGAGSLLAARARRLLADATAIEQELQRFVADVREVRLGAFASAGFEMLPQTFRIFTDRYPDVRLTVRATSGENTALLRDAEVDVLLMWDYDFDPAPVDPSFANTHLADDPMMVVLPTTHPCANQSRVAVTDLTDQNWVIRSHRPSYGEHSYDKMFRLAGITPRNQIAAADYQALQGLVAAGMGIGLAPLLSLVPHRPDVVVLPITGPAFSRRISACTLPELMQPGPVADLVDALRSVATEMTTPTA